MEERKKYVCANDHVTEREPDVSYAYCSICFLEWVARKFPVHLVLGMETTSDPPEVPKP